MALTALLDILKHTYFIDFSTCTLHIQPQSSKVRSRIKLWSRESDRFLRDFSSVSYSNSLVIIAAGVITIVEVTFNIFKISIHF